MENDRGNTGSDFDDFITEEGLRDEVEATATKRVITLLCAMRNFKAYLWLDSVFPFFIPHSSRNGCPSKASQ